MGIVKRQGLSNTLLVYAGTAIGFLSLVVVQPHFLSKEELGLTRLILAFSSVFSILFSLGISAVTIRYLPKAFHPESRHRGFFGFLLSYTLAGIIAGTLVLHLAKGFILRSYVSGAEVFNEHFNYVLILTIILAFVLGLNAYCIALMRTVITTVLNDIVVRLLLIAIIFVRYSGFFDRESFLLAFCGIYAIQAMVLLLAIHRGDRPGLRPDLNFFRGSIGLRPIFRYGLIITLTALNSVTLKYVDTMFVGTISLELVAVYSVSAFLGLAVEIPLNALERVANPSVAHAFARGDMSVVRTVYRDSARALLLFGGWLFLLVAANAKDLFTLLPDDYDQGVIVTQVIALGALINMGTGVNYPILANSHRYIWGSVFLVVLLLLTIAGNIVLIPKLGMLGAAIAGCIASVVYNGLKFEFIRRVFGMQPFDGSTAKLILVIFLVLAIGALLPMPGGAILSISIRSVLITAVYVLLVLGLRTSTGLYTYVPDTWRKRLPFLRTS